MKFPNELYFRWRRSMPVIYSAQVTECGLSCVAMISNFHGRRVTLNGLRQKFPISLAGMNLRTLIMIAGELGFSSRAIHVEHDELSRIQLPAIVHWNHNHFVVLKEVKLTHVTIHDPSLGSRRYSITDFLKSFTGVALELSPEYPFTFVSPTPKVGLRSLWTGLHGAFHSIAMILGLSLALQCFAFISPFQMQLITDYVIGNTDVDLLFVVCFGFLFLGIIQAFTGTLRDWSVQLISNQLIFQMVGNIVHHILRLPAPYFETRSLADIISRISSTKAIQDTITQAAISALIDGIFAISSGVMLFVYSWKIGMIAACAVFMNIIVSYLFIPHFNNRMKASLVTGANEQAYLMETIRAISTIKLAGLESERESSWRNQAWRSYSSGLSLNKLRQASSLIVNVQSKVFLAITLYIGAVDVLNTKGMSIGMLLAVLSFRQNFIDGITSLVGKGLNFKMLEGHLDRLADIIQEEAEPRGNYISPADFVGKIYLKDVSFRYGTSDHWVFQNLTLKIDTGEFLSIAGPSGGGKTTLLKLILGLLEPTSGEILVDGFPAGPHIWRTWRTCIGVVSQEDRLFTGSLADNISFFDPDIDMDRVRRAAKSAQIEDEILRMPMGFLTRVGDMGAALSGGQKQRVLIARALYRNPKILILDEGTANLDPANEELIANMIASLPITRIVVAHRPALINKSDRVVRLTNGQIESAV